MLESFTSFLSRKKTHPELLITSATGIPEWISSLEVLKLAVGTCDFTCCQRNHKFGDKIVPCDRGITREILLTLIASKVKHLFKTEQFKLARLTHCATQVWTRGPSSLNHVVSSCTTLADLKLQLRWDESIDNRDSKDPWEDRAGISILAYTIGLNKIEAVREVLQLLEVLCIWVRTNLKR